MVKRLSRLSTKLGHGLKRSRHRHRETHGESHRNPGRQAAPEGSPSNASAGGARVGRDRQRCVARLGLQRAARCPLVDPPSRIPGCAWWSLPPSASVPSRANRPDGVIRVVGSPKVPIISRGRPMSVRRPPEHRCGGYADSRCSATQARTSETANFRCLPKRYAVGSFRWVRQS